MQNPELIELIRSGAVGVLPTDTQYGLVSSVAFPDSIRRLYDLKRRTGEPGTLLAGSIEQLEELGLATSDLKQAKSYWPGPVSVIIPCGNELEYLHFGRKSLAVRIPAEPQLCQLLMVTGVLQTSSANLTGLPSAETINEAQAYFADTVDFYVNGGSYQGRLASTIIRIVDGSVEVLRQGAAAIN